MSRQNAKARCNDHTQAGARCWRHFWPTEDNPREWGICRLHAAYRRRHGRPMPQPPRQRGPVACLELELNDIVMPDDVVRAHLAFYYDLIQVSTI